MFDHATHLAKFTPWKVSVFGVILVRIFPHSDWVRRDNLYLVRMRGNADQNNSKYEHFLRSDSCTLQPKMLKFKGSFTSITSWRNQVIILNFGKGIDTLEVWAILVSVLGHAQAHPSLFKVLVKCNVRSKLVNVR